MGRHNTVAGRMEKSSAARGRLFTKLSRELMVAARNGADPATNATLARAMEKAKDNSMSKETMERAIKKGSGELSSTRYEDVTYEGYGPAGSAILVDVLTDNRNRTYPEIRRIFQKYGGSIGEMGVVGWMFKKKGVFVINAVNASEDKIMEIALDAGAEDVLSEEGYLTIYTEATDFSAVRQALLQANIPFEKSGLEMIPENYIELSEENYKLASELIEKLEEQDDVQAVYFNFE